MVNIYNPLQLHWYIGQFMCEITVVETDNFTVHGNGIVQPAPVSPLQNTLPDSSLTICGDGTKLETTAAHQYSAALSEATITDSTPGSAVNYQTPSLEEGTILSSISSYRSIAGQPPGLSHKNYFTNLVFFM